MGEVRNPPTDDPDWVTANDGSEHCTPLHDYNPDICDLTPKCVPVDAVKLTPPLPMSDEMLRDLGMDEPTADDVADGFQQVAADMAAEYSAPLPFDASNVTWPDASPHGAIIFTDEGPEEFDPGQVARDVALDLGIDPDGVAFVPRSVAEGTEEAHAERQAKLRRMFEQATPRPFGSGDGVKIPVLPPVPTGEGIHVRTEVNMDRVITPPPVPAPTIHDHVTPDGKMWVYLPNGGWTQRAKVDDRYRQLREHLQLVVVASHNGNGSQRFKLNPDDAATLLYYAEPRYRDAEPGTPGRPVRGRRA